MYKSDMYFMIQSRYCVFCGEKAKSPFLMLRENNIIHNKCLLQVQKLYNDQIKDDAMQDLYLYILKLVIKCSKCCSTIDGSILYVAKEQKQDKFCNKCNTSQNNFDLIFGKKVKEIVCLICQKGLQGIGIETATQIDGLHLCAECSKMQESNLNIQNKKNPQIKKNQNERQKQKESSTSLCAKLFEDDLPEKNMPELIPIKKKEKSMPNLFHLKSQSFKRNHFLCNNNIFSKNNPRVQISKKDEIKDNQIKCKLFPQNQQQKNLKDPLIGKIKRGILEFKHKKQEIQCLSCQQYFFEDEINKEGDFNICFQCSGQIENIKKKDNQKTIKNSIQIQDFQLQDLFKEESSNKNIVKINFNKTNNITEQGIQIKPTPIKLQEIKFQVEQTSQSILKTKYRLTQCKLCFNDQSEMININCRHLMMCFKCYDMYRLKHIRGEQIPCPVCKIKGKYQKYIAPIYI